MAKPKPSEAKTLAVGRATMPKPRAPRKDFKKSVREAQLKNANAKDLTAMIKGERRKLQNAQKHIVKNTIRVRSARECLQEIPGKNETLHCVMRGTFNAYDLIPAMLEMIDPVTIRRLTLATLGFSQVNMDSLFSLIDAGTIEHAELIYCLYHEAHNKAMCHDVAQEFAKRGMRILAAKTHCKIFAIETSDGRHFVFELSANLRSCAMLEQFTLTHSRAVADFHRGWIDELFAEAASDGG